MVMTQLIAKLRLWSAVSLLMVLSACGQRDGGVWSGYVVGDYVYVASALAGRVEKLGVAAGDQVKVGDFLYDLDAELETFSAQEAKARLQNAQALSINLNKGKRSEEIQVVQAQLAQAQAQSDLAQQNLQRQEQLLAQNFVSKATVDDARLVREQMSQRVQELTAALEVARMPARQDERTASQANTRAAENAMRQSDWRQAQKHLLSQAQGVVSEVYFRVGEYVQAGQPVLSVLPVGNVKVRFFIPQSDLSLVSVGQLVRVRCDGCANPIEAKVSRVATQAEYTPPVIYSNSQRSKMVFMVEAKPDDSQAMQLRVGQPVDVVVKP
jgi:HlyD family secretion protein